MIIDTENSEWVLFHQYDPDWINSVKELQGRKYDPLRKCWVVPCITLSLDALLKKFDKYQPSISDRVKKIYEATSEERIKQESYLFDFQQVGVKKALEMKRFLLSDEMGLGKSVSALAWGNILLKEGIVKQVLIVCPKSIRRQWQSETKKFIGKDAEIIDRKGPLSLTSEVSITHYERLRIAKPIFDKDVAIVLDEASKLKNNKTKLYQSVSRAIERCTYVLEMTGTPLENSLFNFYTILKLIHPRFMTWNEFAENFVIWDSVWTGTRHIQAPVGFCNLDKFKKITQPYYIRRVKDQVTHLIPKNYQVRNTNLTKTQQEVEEFLTNEVFMIADEHARLGAIQLLRSYMSEPSNISFSQSPLAKATLEKFPIDSSEKLEELKEILEETDGKVIVFTCFERTATFISTQIGIPHIYITGEVKDKEGRIKDFKEGDKRLLICTDTMSYGVNLDEADVLVHYDLVWNPGVQKQREDRVHRVNSVRQKTIITLLSDSEIEQRVYDVLQQKIKLLLDSVQNELYNINIEKEVFKSKDI